MDIRAAIDRLRPGASYGWTGGDPGDYNNVIWRDPRPQPSPAELQTAWDAIQAGEQQASQLKQQVVTLVQSAVGVTVTNLDASQRNALIAAVLYRLGVLDRTGAVSPPSDWLPDE